MKSYRSEGGILLEGLLHVLALAAVAATLAVSYRANRLRAEADQRWEKWTAFAPETREMTMERAEVWSLLRAGQELDGWRAARFEWSDIVKEVANVPPGVLLTRIALVTESMVDDSQGSALRSPARLHIFHWEGRLKPDADETALLNYIDALQAGPAFKEIAPLALQGIESSQAADRQLADRKFSVDARRFIRRLE